jgi:hypothetical protein
MSDDVGSDRTERRLAHLLIGGPVAERTGVAHRVAGHPVAVQWPCHLSLLPWRSLSGIWPDLGQLSGSRTDPGRAET